MDPLTPVFVRLRSSTVLALKDAKERSSHRTMAAFIDDVLRRHLNVTQPVVNRIDQLTKSAPKDPA